MSVYEQSILMSIIDLFLDISYFFPSKTRDIIEDRKFRAKPPGSQSFQKNLQENS